MTQRTGSHRSFSKFKKAISKGQYRQALIEVNRLLEGSPDQPYLLVVRAELIQLQEDEEGIPELESVREDLQKAIALDERSTSALIELGHYFFSVDDLNLASKCFRKAILLGRAMLEEALIGQAEVFHEQGQDTEAFACLTEAHLLGKRNKAEDERFIDRMRFILQSQ